MLYYPVGLRWAQWIYSDSQKKDLGDSVFEVEDLLGLNLERPDFTVSALVAYGSLLVSILESGIYMKISKEELKQMVLSMRETAKYVTKEITASASDVKSSLNNIIKEENNERTHKKKG